MILICLLIPAGAELLNALFSYVAPGVQFDWRSLAESARDYPWSKGLMVTLMVLSTLVPTVIHIVLALLAVMLQSFMGAPIVGFLKQYNSRESHFYLFGAAGLLTLYSVVIVISFYSLYWVGAWFSHLEVAELLYSLTMWVWGEG